MAGTVCPARPLAPCTLSMRTVGSGRTVSGSRRAQGSVVPPTPGGASTTSPHFLSTQKQGGESVSQARGSSPGGTHGVSPLSPPHHPAEPSGASAVSPPALGSSSRMCFVGGVSRTVGSRPVPL